MKPYLICLDLDGTLLNDNKEISDYTKSFNFLTKTRSLLDDCNWTSYRASQIYYHELNMNTPIVNFNGAYVHHPKADDFETKHEVLDVDIARSMIEALQKLMLQTLLLK